MPITNAVFGSLMIFGLFAGLSVASGLRIEVIAIAALLVLALCGGGVVFWRYRQCKTNVESPNNRKKTKP